MPQVPVYSFSVAADFDKELNEQGLNQLTTVSCSASLRLSTLCSSSERPAFQ